jgi:hypothetical protein
MSGSNRDGPVWAALRVPSYAAPPLGRQMTHCENQLLSKLPGLMPSTTRSRTFVVPPLGGVFQVFVVPAASGVAASVYLQARFSPQGLALYFSYNSV